MTNSYFKLIHIQGGFGLQIVPPQSGGEELKISEVSEYLSLQNLKCDIPVLNSALHAKEEVVIPLGTGPCPAVRESYKLMVSEDNMSVIVRFYPASDTGSWMDAPEFLNDLRHKQIISGIRTEAIQSYFQDRQFCTDILAAAGKEPRHGSDAKIEYYFNTDLRAKPTLQEDGSVDFFHLNTINHCKKDAVLARLIPEDMGEFGENVLGVKIKPRTVKRAILRGNQNTYLSEDKRELISSVDGHVVLVDDKVFVSNVYQVENVDNATGNIEYEGSVEIHGNVSTNFSVKAKGNIIVNGVVEGAFLEAGGDIIIARGMNGMSKGTLKAGGNVVAKFLENATVTAAGYVSTESILHSTVMAGTEVNVDGRRGFIVGGRVSATNTINVKTLGSPMGASTLVEVGTDPAVKLKYQENQKQVAETGKILKSLEPIITTYINKRQQGVQLQPDQIQYLKSILKLREVKQQEMEQLVKEQEEMQTLLDMQGHASVVVTGEVYPGTKIAITDVSTVVQSSMKYCKFVKLRGDVKMVGI